MKFILLQSVILIAAFSSNTFAAKPQEPPQDVVVINDTTKPVPVAVLNLAGDEYAFVGPSTDPVISFALGSQGTVCRAAHGPDARWATTKELVEAYESGATSTFPSTGTGWIARPIITIGTGTGTYLDPYARTSLSSPGLCLSLNENGVFESSPCFDSTGSVFAACSTPK